jgi:hypothetical protein
VSRESEEQSERDGRGRRRKAKRKREEINRGKGKEEERENGKRWKKVSLGNDTTSYSSTLHTLENTQPPEITQRNLQLLQRLRTGDIVFGPTITTTCNVSLDPRENKARETHAPLSPRFLIFAIVNKLKSLVV